MSVSQSLHSAVELIRFALYGRIEPIAAVVLSDDGYLLDARGLRI